MDTKDWWKKKLVLIQDQCRQQQQLNQLIDKETRIQQSGASMLSCQSFGKNKIQFQKSNTTICSSKQNY